MPSVQKALSQIRHGNWQWDPAPLKIDQNPSQSPKGPETKTPGDPLRAFSLLQEILVEGEATFASDPVGGE